MNRQLTTGEVARTLATTEPRLNDLIRRGKITPAPVVLVGRRAWEETHIRQAAKVLDVRDIDRCLAASRENLQ